MIETAAEEGMVCAVKRGPPGVGGIIRARLQGFVQPNSASTWLGDCMTTGLEQAKTRLQIEGGGIVEVEEPLAITSLQ